MDEFWAISSYFNPFHFETKKRNFSLFEKTLASQGVPLRVVEVSFDGIFELEENSNYIRILGKDLMWQKERILNIALRSLPSNCKMVAWLDCDIFFENQNWLQETVRALKDYPIVQPFDTIVRLPKDHTTYQNEGEVWNSFSYIYKKSPQICLNGDFDSHGHSGFVWAARKEVLQYGLYDACIIGSGDHVMSHAFCGDWEGPCIHRVLGKRTKHLEHFIRWSKKIYPLIRGKIHFVPGKIFHLWHGETKNRRYVSRNRKLVEFGFDPELDLKTSSSGLWEWNSKKKHMHDWINHYFQERREDSTDVISIH